MLLDTGCGVLDEGFGCDFGCGVYVVFCRGVWADLNSEYSLRWGP